MDSAPMTAMRGADAAAEAPAVSARSPAPAAHRATPMAIARCASMQRASRRMSPVDGSSRKADWVRSGADWGSVGTSPKRIGGVESVLLLEALSEMLCRVRIRGSGCASVARSVP